MRTIFIAILLLFCLNTWADDTLTYVRFKYEVLHYNYNNGYVQNKNNHSDYIMSGIILTGTAAMNILYLSNRVTWIQNNNRYGKPYKNSGFALIGLDVFVIGIQLIYYLRKE